MMIGMNAKFIRDARLEEELGNSLVIKEPIGVVGCVTPWNYPLHQVVCKIAPALAAGCTIVLKPAEMAPLSAFMLAEAAHEIGLPKGVLNVVSGPGRVVGEAIVAHPDVDMVSFTGSLQAGRRIASVAGEGIKRVVSSWAASPPLSCSMMRRSTRRFPRASTTACRTRGKPVRRGRGCSCRDRGTTRLSRLPRVSSRN
jgi:acyl-CoA reductase-like NAD-dependent aldehyde dehydrogenase